MTPNPCEMLQRSLLIASETLIWLLHDLQKVTQQCLKFSSGMVWLRSKARSVIDRYDFEGAAALFVFVIAQHRSDFAPLFLELGLDSLLGNQFGLLVSQANFLEPMVRGYSHALARLLEKKSNELFSSRRLAQAPEPGRG